MLSLHKIQRGFTSNVKYLFYIVDDSDPLCNYTSCTSNCQTKVSNKFKKDTAQPSAVEHFVKKTFNHNSFKIKKMPQKRIEFSTPGLQDQCSNHWATRAHEL